MALISQFKHGNPNDLNYQKQIIDIFLNSIYVYDDRYVFTYNFHGGTETIPREAVEEAFGSDLTRLAPQTKTGTLHEWLFLFVLDIWRVAPAEGNAD
jgi:hypothetical protein